MNILYLSSEYPPDTGNGGIGTYTQHIAEGMARLNHSVSVITASNDGREVMLKQNGVTVYRILSVSYPLPQHAVAFPIRKCVTTLFPHTLHRLCRCIAVRRKVRHLVKRCCKFDIIESPECGAEGLLIPSNSYKCMVIRFHTPWEMVRSLDNLVEAIGDRSVLPLMERCVAKRATALSSPSQAMKLQIEHTWGIPHIAVIPNPLPVDNHIPSEGTGWIFTGRIERRKGVHLLVKAYVKLCAEYSHVPSLTLLGRPYGVDQEFGNYGDYIKGLIASSVHGSSIHWINHVSPDKVRDYLQSSSVAFFPSLWENYPYACLEAMSSGCTVVASDCGGFSEIIEHDTNGILVPPNSEHTIYEAMKRLICTPSIIQELGSNARNRVRTIASADVVCRTMELFYQTTIKEHA